MPATSIFGPSEYVKMDTLLSALQGLPGGATLGEIEAPGRPNLGNRGLGGQFQIGPALMMELMR